MRQFSLLALVGLFFSMFGCASVPHGWGEVDEMDVFMKKERSYLIQKWGAPDQIFDADEQGKIYTYESIKTTEQSSSSYSATRVFGFAVGSDDTTNFSHAIKDKKMFYVDSKGTIYYWLWNRFSSEDYVNYVKEQAVKGIILSDGSTEPNGFYADKLGSWYEQGNHVEKNLRNAVKNYAIAANHGSPEGKFDLGRCYENGIGTIINMQQAENWYRRSAGDGYEPAQKMVESLEAAKKTARPGQ